MEISSDRRTVHQCLEQRFALPSYQREYKWEPKHFQELLQDIQEAFFANYMPEHGRSAVAKYDRYFLGTIITTAAADGQRTIVDGQQRITTLALIIAYFARLSKQNPSLGISDIASQLRRNVFGQNEFNISFDPPRRKLFELLIDHDDVATGVTLDAAVDSIANLDDGSKRLYELFGHADNLIGQLDKKVIAFLVDYLTQCVILFEISVPGEQDGHKVFVTMNDRGLKLTPIDLLKGYLLSSVPDDAENITAHQAWRDALAKLTSLGSDEDSTFFKTWLRAQYADSSRGKQKGALPGDFEVVSDAYHRWVVDNRNLIGLNNSDDFYSFLTSRLPWYVDQYVKIKQAERSLSPAYPHVFYNGVRDLTLQSMLILAAIAPTDTQSEVAKKIKLVSYFLDCYAAYRIANRQDNTYNNLRDPLFELAKQIRNKSSSELAHILHRELLKTTNGEPLNIGEMRYYFFATSDLLHILARFADFLEQQFEATNKVGFDAYVQRGKGNKTFDIEHILPRSYKIIEADLAENHDFPNETEFNAERNGLGAMILLSRGRNRSLQGQPYSAKLGVYSTESILAQTLTENFYKNNPQATDKLAQLGLSFASIAAFNGASIKHRANAYNQMSAVLWNANDLFLIAG